MGNGRIRAVIAAKNIVGQQRRNKLLQRHAQFFDQCGFDHRAFALGDFFSHRDGHRPQRRELAEDAPGQLGGLRAVPSRCADKGEPFVKQHQAGVNTLGAAAFKRQFGRDLRPALAFCADQSLVIQHHVVKKHFAELAVSGQVFDGAHQHAGQLQINNHLREALLTVCRVARGAHQGDHEVPIVGVAGPDFLAVQKPAFGRLHGARAHAGEVRARVGFTHANAKKRFTSANRRDVTLLLRFSTVFENQRRALPVGDPVGAHRRART